jgi:diaminohydroxyphosphoribosylaminopyrimidine deaminase/5-amino-6-(5-phosphoribosylamino)uracil reductase
VSAPESAAATSTATDHRFMRLALALGRRGLGRTWPNPAVGALIVQDGEMVGRGWTQPGGRPHAEIEALRRAGATAHGATLYVTLEPCSHHGKSPPCADAVIAAGIARVVSALEDPNPEVAGAGHARLRDAGIVLDIGIEATAAKRDHAGHIRRMREHRPQVMIKLAISADGKAAGAGGKRVAITGEAVRNRVHLLRAQSDAIMIGIGTALSDDPVLTCRLPGMAEMSPVRVVLDSKLRLPLHSRLVQSARDTPLWVVGGEAATRDAEEALRGGGVEVIRTRERDDLAVVLNALGSRGVTRLMVEGGPTLASALLAADLVDEAVLFHSPKVIGDDGVVALNMQAQETLKRRLTRISIETVGPDREERYEREVLDDV